jgi:predicted amidohydrolase
MNEADSTTLAVAQFNSAVGKTPQNLSAVARLCASAAEKGTQFVLFPEDALTGYPSGVGDAAKVAIPTTGDELRQLNGLARKFKLTIAVGFIERHGDVFHSSQAVATPEGDLTILRKRAVDARDERIGLTPSHPENPDLTIRGVKAALCICMDGTPGFFDAAGKRGARIILHPSGGACTVAARSADANAVEIESKERAGCAACLESARSIARRLNVVYCVANPVGFDGERGYPGNSFIISPAGEVLAAMEGTAIIEQMREGVVTATVKP